MGTVSKRYTKIVNDKGLCKKSWPYGKMDEIEQNIIIGSLLGDGSLPVYIWMMEAL